MEDIPVEVRETKSTKYSYYDTRYRPVPGGCLAAGNATELEFGFTTGVPANGGAVMITAGHALERGTIFNDVIYQPTRKTFGDNNAIATAWQGDQNTATTFDAGYFTRDTGILFAFNLAEDNGGYGRQIDGRVGWDIIKDTLIHPSRTVDIEKQGKETGRTVGPLTEVVDVEDKVFAADMNASFGDSGAPSYMEWTDNPDKVASLGILNGEIITGGITYTAIEEVENRFNVTV